MTTWTGAGTHRRFIGFVNELLPFDRFASVHLFQS